MFTIPYRGDLRAYFEQFTDFEQLPNWLEALNDGASGTNTLNDAFGGTYSLVTAAADNDYHWLASKAEVIRPAAGKPIKLMARLRLTEANTDDANIVLGLSDTVTATALANDGAGPTAANKSILLYKVDGGTKWRAGAADGTAVKADDLGDFTSGAWHELGFLVNTTGADDATAEVLPFLDGTPGEPFRIALASFAAEMHLVVGVKAGGANAETLVVDWLYVGQDR